MIPARHLWTFVAVLHGRSHVCQFQADSLHSAFTLFCTSQLDWLPFPISDATTPKRPRKLEALAATWQFTVTVIGAEVAVTVVRTDRDEPKPLQAKD